MRQPKDWGQPCPNPECPHDRRMQQGNVSAMAPYLPQRGKRRILCCHTGATHFSETRETVFVALRTSEEKVMMALKMLLVHGDLPGIGFVLGVPEATVLAWLKRAAQQAEAIPPHLLRPLPVPQGQRDELWHFVARKHARETAETGERLPDSADGRQWVWVRLAPEWRLMLAAVGGPRTLDTAQEVVTATKARVAGMPVFCSDGFTGSVAALIAAFHVVTPLARTGKRGRPGQPVWAPQPDLLSGPLVQQKKQGKRLTLSTRVVLGGERLTPLGLPSRTALVERVPLPLPQAWAPWGRKTSSFCKDRERLRPRVVFFHAFSTVARPHMSVQRQWPLPERTRHGAIRPRWRQCTPALAAGVTDHVWTFRELLTVKFEPWESQSISQ